LSIDWHKYARIIKRITLIPLIVGILGLVDGFLPEWVLKTTVISKKDTYRLKTNATTYTIYFAGIDDQVTEEIYKYLNKGDTVVVSYSYFNKQINSIHLYGTDYVAQNQTGEKYAIYGFSVAFILAGLLFFKKGSPKEWQLKVALILSLLSLITGIRML
jgi:hypothetical protein